MAQEASERACDRCRERRVKCDKRQPTCLRCEKLGKPCPGYDKKRKFVDEGVTLRKKFQNVVDRPRSDERPSASKPAGTPSAATPSKPIVIGSPADVVRDRSKPQHVVPQVKMPPSIGDETFGRINPVFFDARPAAKAVPSPLQPGTTVNPMPEPMMFTEPAIGVDNGANDPLMDELWNNGVFDPEWFDLDPVEYYDNGNNTCGFLPNVPNIVNEVDHADAFLSTEPSATPLSTGLGTFSESNLWAPESQLYTSALLNDEREHEMAYLIRHFTESLGPWMDLFDKDGHFSHLVPLKALRDALLRNAIAAVAAKQLGRLKGARPFGCAQTQKPSSMEVLEDVVDVDWFYKAANYYDKAIAYSRHYLQAVSGTLNPAQAMTPNAQMSMSVANSDDLLVAVSIFSLYESLDNLDTGWMQYVAHPPVPPSNPILTIDRHLAGLKSLLLATKPAGSLANQIAPPPMVGRRASFWNFVRADYQVSYIRHQYTLMDTDDLSLWHRNGIQVQPDGSLYKSADYVQNEPMYCRVLTELVSQTLLYLVLRVMNYLASKQDETPAVREIHWDKLSRQLDQWFSNLPATYQPVAQIRHQASPPDSRGITSRLTESFFSIDVCAAGLQLYHFARILLLLHRPPSKDTSAWGSRLKAYREVSGEAIRHAHEIIGIALARPHPAVRVEMLLPLSTAGACLEADDERKVVLDLLKAIELDTGYSTEARCRELVREWGWNQEPQGIA